MRKQIGKALDRTLGVERTKRLRTAERRARTYLASKIAPPPAAVKPKPKPKPPPKPRKPRWDPADPLVAHPTPTMTRHELLRGLHERLSPRTYLEIGVRDGASLTLSRAKSIAVDPAYVIRVPLHCDLDLVLATSDDFFARADAVAHFEGTPVDLAFIDGMHLSEFALRDFINTERHLAPSAVAVFDDVLPRNALEAARDRRTAVWAGDVYKTVEIIARRRPDLVVLLVNTAPTGTAIVVGADRSSSILEQAYDLELDGLLAPDPQTPPQGYLDRSIAVDPATLLASEAWSLLAAAKETGDVDLVEQAKIILRGLPTVSA